MKKEQPKIEAAQDWEKAKNFIPKKDQIVIYDGIKQDGEYIVPPKLKVGDGITKVNDLPFTSSSIELVYLDGEGILIID